LFINKGEVSLPAYTLCVLEKFQDSLHRRDIFVPDSSRWGDTRTKLLTKESWENKRVAFCRSLGHSQDIETNLDRLKSQLDVAYHQKALDKLRQDGLVLNGEDVARLSPLQYKHINVLVHYSFNLSEEVVMGELRKLHLTDYEYLTALIEVFRSIDCHTPNSLFQG
jgi:hypothetical protein